MGRARGVPSWSPSAERHSGSGQEVNRRLPRLSGVTAAPAAVIVLPNRRRKCPIRLGLENNPREAFIPWPGRGGAEVRGGGREEGVEGKQEASTFFLFLRVAVALVFDEAGAGRAPVAGHALQAALHQLAELAARPRRHHLVVLALTGTHADVALGKGGDEQVARATKSCR